MRHDHPSAANLFTRLFSYTPRPGREPLEDYCTEALAWSLRESPTFRKNFLNLLHIPKVTNFSSRLRIDTQFSFKPETEDDAEDDDTEAQGKKGGRFDMVIISPNTGQEFVIVFEMKVSAKFGESQLKYYRKELQKGKLFGKIPFWVVTLTNVVGRDPKADTHIRWQEVQSLLLKTAESIKSEACNEEIFAGKICKYFAEFLGENGMKPIIIPKTTPAQLPERMNGILLFEKLREFLESLRNQDEKLRKCYKKAAVFDRDYPNRQKTFLGIYPKKTGVYFGIQLTNENDAPDFSLYVEGSTRESKLEEKVSSRFKDCLKTWLAEDERWFSIKSKPIVENFDGGNPDKMSEWLLSAIAEARKFANG